MIHPQGAETRILLSPDRAAATATRALTADTRGFSYATITVNNSSAVDATAGTYAIDLQEDDTTVATNFATMVAQVTKSGTATASHVYYVDLRGRQRYLRLLSTPATTTRDLITVSASVSLGRAGEWPQNTTELAAGGATIV